MAGQFFEDLSIGQSASFAKTITNADILMFTAVSGDTNPVHLDAEYAATTRFEGRIAHGMLSAGLISAVLGTHTHVPTADEQILPRGTAFQCDVGMTGPHESILGRQIERVMETTRTFRPTHYEVATGDNRLCGTIVEVDPQTGRATGIRRLCIDQRTAARLAGGAGAER